MDDWLVISFHRISSMIFALLMAGLAVIGICSVLYLHEAHQIEKNTRDRESSRMKVFVLLFQRDIEAAIIDLNILADGEGLRDYLLTGKQADLDRAIHRAVFMSKLQPDYDQIRFIDEKGQEVIRVNWNGAVVPVDQLQNKADRPYFQKALRLAPGQIYISKLDLNVEHGQIETPFNPTIRFATPIFDATGRLRGIYVINYRVANSLARLQQFVPQFQQRMRLLNAEGYWLKGMPDEQEWGFMFPGREGMTLARTDPSLWAQITGKAWGQLRQDGGLFTWNRIVPTHVSVVGANRIVAEENYLVMASEVSPSEWNALFSVLRETYLVIALVLLLLMLASWSFFHSRQRARIERDRFFNLTRDMLCIAGFDGYFKRVNSAWQETLGYNPKEMLARPFVDFVHPDDREKTIAETARLASGGETIFFENRYLCEDGSYRWLSWTARSLVEEKLIFASARDLTERKRIEGQILTLNQQLKDRADQLEVANKELEAFSYSVSHDLRAPLRHIDGFAEMLVSQSKESLDERGRRYVNTIAKSARQMGRLIDDLLVFSRMGRLEMKQTRINMKALVEEVIANFQPDTKDRAIHWKIDPLPEAPGDLPMVRQVWANLIENALKYTRPRNPAEIKISSTDVGDELVYSIHDNGVGFDMRYAEKLFGVFQRMHSVEQFEGTGIGLANVRRIISRHGGRTWAEGKVDGGATVFFSLPKKFKASS